MVLIVRPRTGDRDQCPACQHPPAQRSRARGGQVGFRDDQDLERLEGPGLQQPRLVDEINRDVFVERDGLPEPPDFGEVVGRGLRIIVLGGIRPPFLLP